jgi:aminopeptidase N
MRIWWPALIVAAACLACPAGAAPQQAPPGPSSERPPSRDDLARGEYGPYRANNDVLSYRLDVRIDPDAQSIAGSNAIEFRMLRAGTRIQLDLHPDLRIDGIVLGQQRLTWVRSGNSVFVDFPDTLESGRTYTITVSYSGHPKEQGRFGGMAFRKDPAGRHWITTAAEDEGPSVWWPNKDQWRDEVEHMDISVAVPNGLVDVSNGSFIGTTDLGDGYTRWNWRVQYPINGYGVALNIGAYAHLSDRHGDLPLDYYVLPENVDRAKQQFAQVKPMLDAFEQFIGPYPFPKDGFKLVEVPYAGMEHQSAVAYGNGFTNGYLGKDFTGVGISTRFDFIIIHESAHEWFGNAVTAADPSDMWIHEAWATYLETIYVEHEFGRDAALSYVNGYKPKIANAEPILTQRGINRQPSQDQYFKGALFLNTLRSVIDDDERWWAGLRAYYQRFRYQTILTEDVVRFFNGQFARDLTPIFDQYLRRARIPTLEVAFDAAAGTMAYRWKADEREFAMPVLAGAPGRMTLLHPTTAWQVTTSAVTREEFEVATDRYYVNVVKENVKR